jgi:hypothetical protein
MQKSMTKFTQQEFQSLTADYNKLKEESEAYLAVANDAANRLFQIQDRLAPQTRRRFSVITALFHLREIINLIQEVIKIIQEFRDKLSAPKNPAIDSTNTKN